MSYYNRVLVIFEKEKKLDLRFAGQILPNGAIPLAIINLNTGQYTEIINEYDKKEIINFAIENGQGYDNYNDGDFENLMVLES